MRRIALMFGLLALSLLAWDAPVTGQSGLVTMNQEPHHKRLTYIRHMRVFDANLAPGESTLDHVYDHDAATLVLGDGTTRTRRVGEDWGAPVMRTLGSAEFIAYAGTPVAHRTENVGTTPFRMFVIENLRDSGWSTPAPLTAPGTTLRQEGRSFAVYDVRLDAATPRTNHVHQNPSMVVLLSGAVQVQGGGGESEFRMEQTGRWFPSSGSDQPHTLTAVGTGEARVVCIEAR